MHARLGEVYEHMETTHYKQLTTRLQRLKQMIDRFGDRFEQFRD